MVTAKRITKNGQPVLVDYAERDSDGNYFASVYRKIGSAQIARNFFSVEDICDYFTNDANKMYFIRYFSFVYQESTYRLRNMSLNVRRVQEGWLNTNILFEKHEQDKYVFCYSLSYTENSFTITGIDLITGTKTQFMSANMSDIDMEIGPF